MSQNNQEIILLNTLLQASHLNIKQSLFQQQTNKHLNNTIVQHHINALVKELIPLLKDDINVQCLKKIRGRKLLKKPNKSNVDRIFPELFVNLRVPNIKAHTDFTENVSLDKDIDGKIDFFHTKNIDEFLGLKFDAVNLTLSGNVEQVGDQQFDMFGTLALANGQTQRVVAKLKVTFVPDPKLLWKNIPSDETERFHKPDSFKGYCENNNMLLMGTSVRGRSHAHKGIHRDDDFKLLCDNSSDWSVTCVADGAGSCKYSRQGAFVAVDTASSTLKETLNGHYGSQLELAYNAFYLDKNETTQQALLVAYQHTIVKAVFNAAKAIQDCVDPEKGDRIKDFSTTLILAAHKKVADGYLVVSFWIGDGGVVIYTKNKKAILMGEPDSGEFAGQTRFLDNKIFEGGNVYKRVKMEKVDSMNAVILATDGITDAWFETEKQLESLPHWDKLWEELEPHVMNIDRDKGIRGLTEWMDFWSKGNHDDRTLSICLVKD
jgi:serine/threonine protein phosphatase PrpC